MARHSKIPKAQRSELALAVLRGTEKLEVLARRHQVSTNTLRRWRDEFLAGGRDRLTGNGDAGLLHQRKKRIDQRAGQEVARLYQLLPKASNELWQTDVTYIPIAGYGWWYAITVIDYYSRYLLALHFTHSYSATEASQALRTAVAEAERFHGLLEKPVFLVTDNGPSFIAHRFRDKLEQVQIAATGLSAFSQVRIGYRMPTQLGLLERFHGTLKAEEVYWNLYADPREGRQKLGLYRERFSLKPVARQPACRTGGPETTRSERLSDATCNSTPR